MTRRSDTPEDGRPEAAPRSADIIPFRRTTAPEAPPEPTDPEQPDDDGPSAA